MKLKWISTETFLSWEKEYEPQSNVFARGQWRKMYGDRVLFLSFGNDQIEGVFVFYRGGKLNIRSVITPPLAPFVGFSVRAEFASRPIPQPEDILLAIRDEGFSSVSLNFPPEVRWLSDAHTHSNVKRRHTYRLDLSLHGDDLLAVFDQKTRNVIHKAAREGLYSQIVEDKNSALMEIADHFNQKGIKSGREFLGPLFASYAHSPDFFVVKVNDRVGVLWTGVFLMDRTICYYLLGARNSQRTSNSANAFGLQAAMQEAMRRGAAMFDFEGSMIPAIERFFKGFGGVLVNYPSLNWSNSFWNVIQRLRK